MPKAQRVQSMLDRLRDRMHKATRTGPMETDYAWWLENIENPSKSQLDNLEMRRRGQRELDAWKSANPHAYTQALIRQRALELMRERNRLDPEYRRKYEELESYMREMYPWDSRGNAVDVVNKPASRYYNEIVPQMDALLDMTGDIPLSPYAPERDVLEDKIRMDESSLQWERDYLDRILGEGR